MHDKRIYNKAIAISEDDLHYLRELKKLMPKKSLAGILALMINEYKQKYEAK